MRGEESRALSLRVSKIVSGDEKKISPSSRNGNEGEIFSSLGNQKLYRIPRTNDGGDLNMAKHFVNSLNIFMRGVSLGGVETLISHPASTTHSIICEEDRAKAGITDSLMRLSVGIEDVEDLIKDLDQAFAKIRAYRQTLIPEQ